MNEYVKARRKPLIYVAAKWEENGDHPDDQSEEIFSQEIGVFMSEGRVVRRYRHPAIDGGTVCDKCKKIMNDHGWVDTLEDGHTVCPGDWIMTGVNGEHWPVKPDVFKKSYDIIGT